jgi:anthranilate phosphoribosyltransferase
LIESASRSVSWPELLGTLTAGADLGADRARAALAVVLAGEATPAQIAALIVALRMKGETVDELSGMVDAMLDAAAPLSLPEPTIDIVGMGGAPSRRRHALNVSTMASIVAAAAGATVCKHGNRKASSTSGSFDFLEALGVNIDLDGPGVERCVEHAGVGFCFARSFHPAMRHAGPVRAELGIPTVFNVLGPLSHPGRISRQVIGVSDPALLDRVAALLAARRAVHSWVVHGHGDLDEITTTGPTEVREVRGDMVTSFVVDPGELGIEVVAPDALAGGDAAANASIFAAVLAGERPAVADIVALNAAAGLVVGSVAATLSEGLDAARSAIDDGRVAATLDRLVETSHR